MNQPPEPDDRLAQRMRRAHELLDEQPSVKVRSAILAAAAQRPKQAPGGGRSRWSWLLAWRPPLAAGAAIFAGVLAITIGLRVEREQGAGAPSTGPGETGEDQVAPGAKSPSSMPPRTTLETGRTRRAPQGQPPAQEAAPLAPEAAKPKAARSASGEATAGASASPQTDAQLAPGPAAPAARPSFGASVVEPGAPAREAIPNLQPGALTNRQSWSAPAREPAPAADSNAAYTASPERWLERIAELRAAGHDAEAEQELARFTATYPNLPVPSSARRR